MKIFLSLVPSLLLLTACGSTAADNQIENVNAKVPASCEIPEVIDEFANNRGSSIIVVDEKNKPVGRILADDLVDALAATSDTQGFAQGSGAL